MAIHPNTQSMLYESLPEMLLVAKYCIEFRKDGNTWPSQGCYGYPAALLLLSIVDSIGSYVEQGSIDNRFKILNNDDYYGLNITHDEIVKLRKSYRDLLSHNTVLATNVGLKIGTENSSVIEKQNNRYWLNLVPFYGVSIKAVNSLLNNPGILKNNQTILNIEKKS